MWEQAKALKMTNEQRATLAAWVRAKTSPQRTVLSITLFGFTLLDVLLL